MELELCEKFGELVLIKTTENTLSIDSFENSTILLDKEQATKLYNFLNKFIEE